MNGRSQSTPEVRALAFVGRGSERRALVAAADRARAGRGSLVLVSGEAGIGKTSLVREALAGASARTSWATCWDGDGTPPFWPWTQLLRELLGEDGVDARRISRPDEVAGLAKLVGEPDSGAETTASRFAMFDSVASAILRAGDHRSRVLVLEDLHWADEPSLHLLHFLSTRLAGSSILVVGTYRDTDLDDEHPLMRSIDELGLAAHEHLALRGLGVGEFEKMVATMGGDAPVPAAAAAFLHGATAGNPFFARELFQLLAGEGRVEQLQLDSRVNVPKSVTGVLLRRLARLTHTTSDVLMAGSVLGIDVDLRGLHAITGLDRDDLVRSLDEATRRGLVVQQDSTAGRFTFAHALVREVLYEQLPVLQRINAHRRVAEAMEADATAANPVSELAHHFMLASPGGGADKAVTYATRAAEAAFRMFAYEDAAAWYQRALDAARLAELGAGVRADLLMGLGAASLAQGQLSFARDSYLQSAELARSLTDPDRLARAALGLGSGLGGFEVGLFDRVQLDLLEEALAALDPSDSRLRAWVLARLSVALSYVGLDERRLELSEAAVGMARRIGDADALGHALACHCDAVAGPDHCEARTAAAGEIVALAQQSNNPELELLGRRLRVVAWLEQGRVGEAEREIAAFERVAEQLRQPLYLWYVPLWRATLALVSGNLEGADEWSSRAAVIGAAAHSENARLLTGTQRWLQLRAAHRFDEAGSALVDAFGGWAEQVGEPGWMGIALVEMGRNDEARDMVSELTEQLANRPRDGEWLPSLVTLSQAAVALDLAPAAKRAFDLLVPYSHRFVIEGIAAGFLGSVSWHLAPLARFLGRADEADEYDDAALEAHAGLGIDFRPPPLVGQAPVSQSQSVRSARESVPLHASLDQSGDRWAITFGGLTVEIRDSKGIQDLAALLTAPDTDVHVADLTGTVTAQATGPALDDRAIREYRQRLADLETDIDDAEANNDIAFAERLASERDFLIRELTGALGLGGRARRPGDPVERARKAVAARLRDCISKLTDVHPALGRHLANSVKTGTLCSYRPEQPVIWRVAASQTGIARR